MKAARVCLLVGITLPSLACNLDFTVVGRGRVDLYRWCTFYKEGIQRHIQVPWREINFEFITLKGVVKERAWAEDDLRLQPLVDHREARFDIRLDHVTHE